MLVKALLFRSFHESDSPTAGFRSVFICGRSKMSQRLIWKRVCEANPAGENSKICSTLSFIKACLYNMAVKEYFLKPTF